MGSGFRQSDAIIDIRVTQSFIQRLNASPRAPRVGAAGEAPRPRGYSGGSGAEHNAAVHHILWGIWGTKIIVNTILLLFVTLSAQSAYIFSTASFFIIYIFATSFYSARL